MPVLLRDQKIDKPSRRISRAIILPETGYIKAVEAAFAKVVGSKAVANTLITAFDETPAQPNAGSQSLTDYAIECLQEGKSFITVTGHIDRLTDVAEFNQALSLAVARREGKKYMPQFKVVINKNMAWESIHGVPAAWLASFGQGIYWGAPPGESARAHGITDETIDEVNGRMMVEYLADKQSKAVALALVPHQSGLKKDNDGHGELWVMKDASPSEPLLVRSEGGIIPGNRYGDSIMLGSVIPVERPQNMRKKAYAEQLTTTVALKLAQQTHELTGLRVAYNDQMVGKAAMAGVTLRGSYLK